MKKNGLVIKLLVLEGAFLLWMPLLMPFLLLIAAKRQGDSVMFDFLIPMKLFPIAFVGALLLIWVAFIVKDRQIFIGWGSGFALFTMIFGQFIASVTGVSSGTAAPGGAASILAVGMMILYDLALVFVGVHALLLAKSLIWGSRESRIQED